LQITARLPQLFRHAAPLGHIHRGRNLLIPAVAKRAIGDLEPADLAAFEAQRELAFEDLAPLEDWQYHWRKIGPCLFGRKEHPGRLSDDLAL